MPNNSNRKSRDDKSFNNNRFDSSSKTERPDKTNTERNKKFDGDRKKSFGDRPSRPERPSTGGRDQDRKRADDRPYAKKSFSGSGDKSRDFKTGGDRTYGADKSSTGSRSQSDRPYEKKPYGTDRKPFASEKRDRKPLSGEDRRPRSTDSRPQSDRPYEKKPYSADRKPFGDDKRERKPLSGEGRRSRSTDSRPQSDRPYERKPYSADRKPFGDDKRERKPLSGEDRRPRSTDSRPQSDRPYERKPYNADGKPFGDDKRERKPLGGEDRRSRNTDSRPQSDRPYERKPYGNDRPDRNPTMEKRFADRRFDDGENRKWTSEERVEQSNLRPRKRPTAAPSSNPELIRLNRYIANAGICSRRKADELIEAGVITVNGEYVSELGFKINPMKDVIKYNGETLKREKMTYVLLNKPKDYITTTEDPQERRTVMHLVEKASKERIYPVGRLDRNTTGLLLMTNDGDLAEKLSHPRNSVTKIYQVELNKNLSQGDMNKIAFGLELEDGEIKPDVVSYVTGGTKKEIGIQLHSGKNRIVRRIFEHLGYEVEKLDRVVYANLTKKDLPRGRWRYLDEKEIIQLKHLIK